MSKNNNNIKVPVNYHYYNRVIKDDSEFCNEKDCNKIIKNLRKKFSYINYKKLKKEFNSVNIFSFRDQISEYEDEALVYEIKEAEKSELQLKNKENKDKQDLYCIQTGNFFGTLFFIQNEKNETIKLDINSGYNRKFENHMLNYASNVFLRNEFKGGTTKNKNDKAFLFILFLIKLKKVYAHGLPMLMQDVHHRDLSVRGRFDIRNYIRHDIFSYKISTISKEVLCDQNIVDIVYITLKHIYDQEYNKKTDKEKDTDLIKIINELKSYYSGNKVNNTTFEKAYRSKSLRNPMYSGYKSVLKIAEIILKNRSLDVQSDSSVIVSGYLMDISELWEIYLTKLLSHELGNEYIVSGQEKNNLYNGTFYNRANFPDIIIKNTNNNNVAILDAKFKRMDFCSKDVDRSDLHQIHSYGFYYYLKEIAGVNVENETNGKLRFCSLVYPSTKDSEENNPKINIYGVDKISNDIPKFQILSIRIPNDDNEEDIKESEKKLVEIIKNVLE